MSVYNLSLVPAINILPNWGTLTSSAYSKRWIVNHRFGGESNLPPKKNEIFRQLWAGKPQKVLGYCDKRQNTADERLKTRKEEQTEGERRRAPTLTSQSRGFIKQMGRQRETDEGKRRDNQKHKEVRYHITCHTLSVRRIPPRILRDSQLVV